MCDTCGCHKPNNTITIQAPNNNNHFHYHQHNSETVLKIEKDILQKNSSLANKNREYLKSKNIIAINLMSSPGSGKTTILEKTISDLKNKITFSVIEGDQQTLNDAKRIQDVGVPVVQVNTGSGCHLDSEMIDKAVKAIKPNNNSILFIENVGNLVCPAMFDLGESKKVVIISTTEGEDKPIKYPNMFYEADICIINKIDLLPYLDFSVDKCKDYALKVNHNLKFFEVSAKTNEGMDKWYSWLRDMLK